MGAAISNFFSGLFSCCVKGTEHEIKIALGRCNTCNRIPKMEEEEEETDTSKKCNEMRRKIT